MNPELQQRLATLHEDLQDIEFVDPQARPLLMTLLTDITRLLEKSADNITDPQNLAERLDELAVHFEAEHPSLGAALRRVVDALGKAGI
ncbi:MAG TPA: DUF4404 family protein [Povalibacter sp.]